MAVVSSNQRWLNANSGLFSLDFYSWFLGGASVYAKNGVETIDAGCTVVDQESNPEVAKNIANPCDQEGDDIAVPCNDNVGDTCTDQESNSEAAATVENRCDQIGDDVAVASNHDVGATCTTSVIQKTSDLETSELKRMFQTFDVNQDGLICALDLRRFMGRLGLEVYEEEAVSMLATVDHDGDGNVGFEEFCTLYRSLYEENDACREDEAEAEEEDDTMLEAFRVFDTNNDGFISCQELQNVLLALGLPEGKSLKSCELMIRGVDSDGNGEVDIKEFKQMMSSNSFLR